MTTPSGKSGWRAPILQHFSRASAAAGRLTVVGDPDGLLTEPGVIARLGDRGFELITFDDPVAFRYAYESRFRRHWDRGESTHLVVVIRTDRGDLQTIPHDLLEEARSEGRVLSFSLADLFPVLAPNVVAELDPLHYDALSRALDKVAPGQLGENATRDFILRHVFEIAPELIKTPPDLLRVLLRRHYRSRVFPESLDARFIELLMQNEAWRSWPLERIIPGKDAFLTFLEERWPHFLMSKGYEVVRGREPRRSYSISGPAEIPFDHDDIRVYIDNLFAEGFLEPTTAIDAGAVEGSWYRIGVAGDPMEDAQVRLDRLLGTLAEELPPEDADHVAWMQYAPRWAEALSLRWQIETVVSADVVTRMDTLHDEIEERFGAWMLQRYGSIHSLPHLPKPTTLDKIPRYLAHHRTTSGRKLALIVVDGLALDQWLVLRDESLGELSIEEAAAFAWVPTLTAVSRQSIFAGEPPYFYAKYLDTTRKEPHHWARFWDEHGLRGNAVAYVSPKKQETDVAFNDRVRDAADHPQCKVLGVVVGIIDQMMHGVVTGTGGMHAGVRHWAKQRHLRTMIQDLLERDFDVFLTADHGNIEGTGIGKPNVGAVANERGERAHVFPHELTRKSVQEEYPGSVAWPPIALPDDYLPLLPPGRSAFIHEGKRTVGHGGIAIEEVIVPFVQISEVP